MDKKHRHTSIVGPSFLISIGIILLLDNLGYLKWEFWELLRLWPILLIVWGLEILVQDRLYGRILTACVVLLIILGGVWYMAAGSDPRSSTRIEYLRDDASSLVVNLQPSIAKISLDAYNDSANLIGGYVTVPRGAQLKQDFSAGNRARLRLTTQSSTRSWWPGRYESWDLKLNRNALLDMEIDLAIGDMNLNLSKLNVSKITTEFGLGAVNVHLPASGNYNINIDGGIGSIVLAIPCDMAVHITADSGIVSKSVPSDYTRLENVWYSPNYDESENHADIFISLGIGTIVIKCVPDN